MTVLIGTPGHDTIIGTSGDDEIAGLGGDDRLEGELGDDILEGGAGDDQLYGGQGSDHVYGGEGADSIWSIYNEHGTDWLDGGAGDDWIDIGGGIAYLQGGSGTDTLAVDYAIATLAEFSSANGFELWGGGGNQIRGTEDANILDFSSLTGAYEGVYQLTVQSGSGNDVLIGLAGTTPSWLFGNEGDDDITGLAGRDRLVGGVGNDIIRGGAANDELIGESGDDLLFGEQGDDSLAGWDGIDTADYDGAAAGVTASLADGLASDDGDGGSDTFSGIENLSGSAFDDALAGDVGDNQLLGRDGADTLSGGAGADILSGGAGQDTADYSSALGGVVVDLASESATSDGHGSSDTLLDIENVAGSAFADILIGSDADNTFTGGLGNDRIDGGLGDDVLVVSGVAADYRLLMDGDDFILKGPDGGDHLTGVETIRFSDGRVLELNRMYSPGPDGAIVETLLSPASTEEPLVLPPLQGKPTADDAFVLPAVPDNQPLVLPGMEALKSGEEPLVLPGPDDATPRFLALEARLALSGDWMLTPAGEPALRHDDWMG